MQSIFCMPPKRDKEISMATAIEEYLLKSRMLLTHKIISIVELSDGSVIFITEKLNENRIFSDKDGREFFG